MQFFNQFLTFILDKHFFSNFIDKIGILLNFWLKVCKKVWILFQNVKHLDLKLSKLLLQSL